jgi:hypothetical protein
MKRSRIFILAAIVFLATGITGFAQENPEKVIKLRDGMIFRGKILSQDEETYKIESIILGVVSVKASDVVSVEDVAAAPIPPAQIDAYQKKIINDPVVMDSVKALATDPEVVEMLSDPELKSAILRQDLNYLQNNEKFRKFSDNPSVKRIAGRIEEIDPSKEQEKGQN